LCRLLSMPATDGLSSLSVRCIQPIQQQGRRSPFLILSRPTLMRLVRVSASLPLVTQQTHSLRASGVISCHKLSALASPAMAAAKSSGSLCMVPPGNLGVLMSLFYQLPPFSKEHNLPRHRLGPTRVSPAKTVIPPCAQYRAGPVEQHAAPIRSR
jgi:hypothetical protein